MTTFITGRIDQRSNTEVRSSFGFLRRLKFHGEKNEGRDIICEIQISSVVAFGIFIHSFSAREREKREKNLIGLSIELRRRKSFIGRIKNRRERENDYFFFFLLVALIDREGEKGSKSLGQQRKREILSLALSLSPSKEIAFFRLLSTIIERNTSKVSIRIKRI